MSTGAGVSVGGHDAIGGGLGGGPGGPPRRLVLWDIDHTLVHASAASNDAYRVAFRKVTGSAPDTMVPMGGRTELMIASDLLRANGLAAEPATVRELVEIVALELAAAGDRIVAEGRVLDGVVEVLTAFLQRPGLRQSVLTGNTRTVAELKLSLFGLTGFLDLAIGAYGDDAHERSDLPAVAWRRAREERGERYDGSVTVLIGDTTRDIEAARHCGARSVGVATGGCTAESLAAAGADLVLPDLAAGAPLADRILGG